MTQKIYRGEGIEATINLDKPSIRAGVIASMVQRFVRPLARTEESLNLVNGYFLVVTYTRSIAGIDYKMPAWNATSEDVLNSFERWAELDGEFNRWWVNEVVEYQNALPLAKETQDVFTSTATLPPPPPSATSTKRRPRKSATPTLQP